MKKVTFDELIDAAFDDQGIKDIYEAFDGVKATPANIEKFTNCICDQVNLYNDASDNWGVEPLKLNQDSLEDFAIARVKDTITVPADGNTEYFRTGDWPTHETDIRESAE
jgi:hypothetical protein